MEGRQAVFARNLRALNSQFKRWIEQQHSDHLGELWSDGVEDYLKHAKKLKDDFKDVLERNPSGSNKLPGQITTSNTGFGAGPGVALGTSQAWTAQGDGKPAPNVPFGGFGTTAFPAAGMSTVPTFASNNNTNDGEDDGEAEEDKEATQAKIEAEGVEMLFKGNAKLQEHDKAAQKWVDKGPGVLTIRRNASGGTAYLVFTAPSGKVWVNCLLNRKQTIQPSSKHQRKLQTTLIDSVSKNLAFRNVVFTLDKEEDAAEFTKVVQENKPQ